MIKGLSPSRVKELRSIEVDGFRVDFGNYIYGFDKYPKLIRVLDSTGEKELVEELYYQKYYNGTGEYRRGTYLREKAALRPDGSPRFCVICTNFKNKPVEGSNRFSLKRLTELAAA